MSWDSGSELDLASATARTGSGEGDGLSNAGRAGRDARVDAIAPAPWCTIAVHAGGHARWPTTRTSSTGSTSMATTSRTPTATTSCRPDGSSTCCRARSCASRRVTVSRGSERRARSGARTCPPSPRARAPRCESSRRRSSAWMRATSPLSPNGWTPPCAARSMRRAPSMSRAGTSWGERPAGPSRRCSAERSMRRCRSTSPCRSDRPTRWRRSSSGSARAGSTTSS